MANAEHISGVDVVPEPSFLWGACLAYRVTSNRHAPHYHAGDLLLTDERGRVLGFVPAAAHTRARPRLTSVPS
jgi:hypothetical protein